jgi:hypothetical protein
MAGLGRSLIILGIIITVIGIIVTFAGKIPWLGKLPGDIYIRKGNFTFYFPLVTCILLSVFISLIFWLLKK